MEEEEELVSTQQCAELKGVSRQAVHDAVKRGEIPARRVGRSWAIKKSDCEAFQPLPSAKDRGKKGSDKRWGEIKE